VDLCRPSFCLDSGKVIVLLGLVNCFTDYLLVRRTNRKRIAQEESITNINYGMVLCLVT